MAAKPDGLKDFEKLVTAINVTTGALNALIGAQRVTTAVASELVTQVAQDLAAMVTRARSVIIPK
jgi:hypothetical protein